MAAASEVDYTKLDVSEEDWSLVPMIVLIVLYIIIHLFFTYKLIKNLNNVQNKSPIFIWSILIMILVIFVQFNIRYRQMTPVNEKVQPVSGEGYDPQSPAGEITKPTGWMALAQGLIYIGLVLLYFFLVILIILKKTGSPIMSGGGFGDRFEEFINSISLNPGTPQSGTLLTIMIIMILVNSIHSLILYFKNLSQNDNYPYLKSYIGSQVVVFIGAILTGLLFLILQISDSNIFNIGQGRAPLEGTTGTIFRALLFGIILFIGFIYVNGVWMNKDGPGE